MNECPQPSKANIYYCPFWVLRNQIENVLELFEKAEQAESFILGCEYAKIGKEKITRCLGYFQLVQPLSVKNTSVVHDERSNLLL